MTVDDAISAAEKVLPGNVAPEDALDPRLQAVIAVGEFIETEPESVWVFIRRWGASPDEDLRTAIATCLLEHLLEHHFDRFIARVEQAARADKLFAETVCRCGNFGQAAEPDRRARLARLVKSVR